MGKSVDLTGKRFGFLTALERVPERKNGQAFRWICKCDCGSVRDYNYASPLHKVSQGLVVSAALSVNII